MLGKDSNIPDVNHRSLRMESLELRLPLSAAVSAAVVDGTLMIVGSEGADQVGVTLQGSEVVVASLDDMTLINGELEVRFDAASIYGDVIVDLGAGDNVLRVGGEAHEEDAMTAIAAAEHEEDEHDDEARLSILGNLFVTTQFGDDTIRISFVQIGGKVSVETGEGADVVDVGRGPGFAEHDDHGEEAVLTTLVNEVLLAAEEGEDDCSDGGPPPDVKVGDGMTIRTDAGNDAVKVSFTSVGDQLVIFAGEGADQIVTGRGPIRGVHGPGGCEGEEALAGLAALEDDGGGGGDDGGHGGRPVDVRVVGAATINVGPGDDFLMMRNIQVAGDLNVSAHSGSAQIGTQNLRAEAHTVIASGHGADDFAILDSRFAGSFHISSGPGNDLVFIDNSQFAAAVDVALGSFDDEVALRDSTFAAPVTLDGGSGWDGAAWDDPSNIFDQAPVEKKFEYHDLDISAIAAYMTDDETGFGLFLQGRTGGGHSGGGTGE